MSSNILDSGGDHRTLPLERRTFDASCLSGRRFLVTGASSGLGRAAAAALSNCGGQLILLGRDESRLRQTRELLSDLNHAVVSHLITGADEMADLVRSLAAEHGPLDGIFHAAGGYLAMPAKTTKQHHIEAMFAASVWGAYGIGRALAHRNVMRESGSAVFMSSVAGERGHPGTVAYAGAKAAIRGFVPALALELGAKRIRANLIVAGTVETEMHLSTAANLAPSLVADGAARHIFGFGRPSDVANMVVFLMSDASRWITGAAFHVDGGYMAR